jgi:hypothetical protein
MNHNNTLLAYGRKNERLVIVDAHDLKKHIDYLRSRSVPNARDQAISEYGGIKGSFMCANGDELSFHYFKNGHFQHKSNTNTGQSGVNMTCCPCQNKDYETQKECNSILSKILSNSSTTVKFHQFCENCKNGLHGEITVIPNNVTVRLHERTTGNLGYKSGEIKPNVAVYDDQGRQIWLLETSKTNRKTPESRPDNTIEIDPLHVILTYQECIKNGSDVIVLKPITKSHGTCHECITFEEIQKEKENEKRRKQEEEKEQLRKEEVENKKRRKLEEEKEKSRQIENEEIRNRQRQMNQTNNSIFSEREKFRQDWERKYHKHD